MSLDNPTAFEIAVLWLKTPRGRIVLYALGGLVLLGAVLFAVDRIGGWKQSRDIRIARQNVNAAAKALQDAQNAANKDDVDIAVKTIRMQEAVNNALDAVQATDAGKAEVNAAVQNLANAVKASRPAGVTAADIEKRLDSLGVK